MRVAPVTKVVVVRIASIGRIYGDGSSRGNFGIAEGLIPVMLVCEFLVTESKIDYNQPSKTYDHLNCMLDSLERQVTSLISFVPILCARILSVLLISELQIKFAYADIDVGYTD